jgi:hypothetical protein
MRNRGVNEVPRENRLSPSIRIEIASATYAISG